MLTGKRIVLRPLKKDDWSKSLKWRNNPKLTQLVMSHPFPITEELEHDWYEKILNDASNKTIYFAIDEKANEKFIGMVYLNNIDWVSRHCKFHILIGEEDSHSKGYGKETLLLISEYVFNTLNLKKIMLEVVSNNVSAIKLYETFGFEREGLLKQNYFANNQYFNVEIMALFKEKYKSKHYDK